MVRFCLAFCACAWHLPAIGQATESKALAQQATDFSLFLLVYTPIGWTHRMDTHRMDPTHCMALGCVGLRFECLSLFVCTSLGLDVSAPFAAATVGIGAACASRSNCQAASSMPHCQRSVRTLYDTVGVWWGEHVWGCLLDVLERSGYPPWMPFIAGALHPAT